MVDIFQAIILSIVQGITEWLPVSSSGHLAIFQNFFGFQNLAFDVFLHFAAIFAVIIVFWKDIVKRLDIRKKENLKYAGLIIIGIIPVAIIGIVFKHQIESFFSSMFYLGLFFMISGMIVFSTKFSKVKKDKPNLFDALFIGLFQAVSILPGISRSGASISSGLFRGLTQEEAIKFSFFMSIPVILGASIIELNNVALTKISYSTLIVSFIVTLLVSIVSIKVLFRIIKGDKFYLFGIYNFILGICVFAFSFVK